MRHYCVPNDKNELIPQRIVTGYRMVIDFRKLNKATRKDHYLLPFIDQMLEKLSKDTHFCLMDILAFHKYLFLNLIKKRPLLLVLLEPMLTDICLSVYVMHLLPFKDVCLLYPLTFVKILLRFSWTTSPSTDPLLMIA